MVSEASLLIQSKIANSICNLESDGRDEFSTAERTLGWTEIWGIHADDEDSSTEKVDEKVAECWKFEQKAIDR